MAIAEQRWSRVPAALSVAGLAVWLAGGCITIGTDKPIQINVDVTIHVKKDLDSFFGDIDKK